MSLTRSPLVVTATGQHRDQLRRPEGRRSNRRGSTRGGSEAEPSGSSFNAFGRRGDRDLGDPDLAALGEGVGLGQAHVRDLQDPVKIAEAAFS